MTVVDQSAQRPADRSEGMPEGRGRDRSPYRGLWIAFAAIVVGSFAILLATGRQIDAEKPPIPGEVVTTDGEVLLTADDIVRSGPRAQTSSRGRRAPRTTSPAIATPTSSARRTDTAGRRYLGGEPGRGGTGATERRRKFFRHPLEQWGPTAVDHGGPPVVRPPPGAGDAVPAIHRPQVRGSTPAVPPGGALRRSGRRP